MLMRLFAPQFLVVWAFVGSAVAVHLRGKVRLGFWRQVSDHSTIMAPYNALMYLFSAVPNRPILHQGSLPELAVLRDNRQAIRDEALELFARGQIKAADRYNDWGFNSFFRTGWKRFYLKWYDQALPSAVANCPKTVELVNAIPSVKGAMFASPAAVWSSTAIPMPARCAITSG
jgi:beta-hydroxylase